MTRSEIEVFIATKLELLLRRIEGAGYENVRVQIVGGQDNGPPVALWVRLVADRDGHHHVLPTVAADDGEDGVLGALTLQAEATLLKRTNRN